MNYLRSHWREILLLLGVWAFMLAGIAYFAFFGSSTAIDCVVTAIGDDGVTVEHPDGYGKIISADVPCDDASVYSIGDELTVEFRAFGSRIVGRAA